MGEGQKYQLHYLWPSTTIYSQHTESIKQAVSPDQPPQWCLQPCGESSGNPDKYASEISVSEFAKII